MIEMAIVEYALIQAHRNNINRYERLLQTFLTEIERHYIEMRLSEQRAALRLADCNQSLRNNDRPMAHNVRDTLDRRISLPSQSGFGYNDQPLSSPGECDD
jgi:hypothetical protein